MIKILLPIILVVFVAVPAFPAAYYFDLASGNDTTGDGSAGSPWKTIDKCTTLRSAGDECRGAKSTITTLDGTLTFTNGSTSVATSADLTAVVSAGDLVGKNSGLEGWWHVASLNSTTITLTYQYWGLSGSGSAVTGYKITPITASEQYDVASSGSAGNTIKVSGGWNLSNETQEGITAFSSSYNAGISCGARQYIELSKFVIKVSSSYGLSINSNCTVYDIWVSGAATYNIYASGISNFTAYNIVSSGGTANDYYIGGTNHYMYDCNSFSAGTGNGDYGFYLNTLQFSRLKNIKIYNSYAPAMYFSSSSNNFIDEVVVDTIRSGAGILFSNGDSNRFYDVTISGASTYAISMAATTVHDNYFINCDLTAGGSGLVYIDNTYGGEQPIYVVQETGADSVMYFKYGNIEHDSDSCRSGNCLMFTPSSASAAVYYKVGSVKIPSASSDLTLKAYLKDDADFNGSVYFVVSRNAKFISKTEKTTTTSYAENTVVVTASDLVADDYLDLWVWVTGTAGNVWIDDFSASQ